MPKANDSFRLTVKEIVQAAHPYVFPRRQQRSRQLLLDALQFAPPDVVTWVSQVAIEVGQRRRSSKRASKAKKNKRQHQKRCEQVQQSIGAESGSLGGQSNDETYNSGGQSHKTFTRDIEQFLDLPTADQLMDLHRAFYLATSNSYLSQGVCACCARRLMCSELAWQDYLQLPNTQHLCPKKGHPLHSLTHGMLLEKEYLLATNGSLLGWICHHCQLALKQNRLPAFSLANNMWIGPVSSTLSQLTIPEQLLVALRYPRGFVFKLHPRGGKGSDHPAALQLGLRGNVTTYMANAQSVADMLTGQLMPRRPTILPSLIAIAFVGRSKLSKLRLKSLFRVRRRHVYEALLELREAMQHPGYTTLTLDEGALNSMPEDDIPDDIWCTLRMEPNEKVVERESAGYIPRDPEDCSQTGTQLNVNDRTVDGRIPLTFTVSGKESEQQGDLAAPDGDLDNSLGDPDIIPLESTGMSAANGTQITTQEMMATAMENFKIALQNRTEPEGGYAVRHGTFARDFGRPLGDSNSSGDSSGNCNGDNPSTFTFPFLFPCGVGGIEAEREVPVSFADHTRWCLQYHDRRFARHHTFPFWAFSIQQKRQALAASKLVMRRRDFDKVSAAIAGLTAEDLNKASLEEEQGIPYSNPKVALLRRFVRVTMQHVMGSDASRALNRSKLWSTSLYLNPMTLWITINPTDRHDPICQILIGKLIDMDNFDRAAGPSKLERACNVAENPLAAAQFFFFLCKTILDKLFGFNVRGRTSDNRMGALGLGSAYFGVVEAQGRGSLHLHMMMWLRHSPNAEEITDKLKCPEFRAKIKRYVQTNLRSHVDSLEQSVLDSMEADPELAWSRPPNPDSPTYAHDLALLEIKLAKCQQYHQCSTTTCLRHDRQTGALVCKRHAPFELSPEDTVSETGEIKTKRTVGCLNTWCPHVFYGGRCNNDIKFITNGSDARNLGFYVTNYATKKQGQSFNQSAVIAKTYMFHNSTANETVSRKLNASFLFRCGLALNREQEYSGQQVMSYLMGWGDSLQSHTYSPIYWSSVVHELKLTFHELISGEETDYYKSIIGDSTEDNEANTLPSDEVEEDTAEVVVNARKLDNTEPQRIEIASNGTFYLQSQIVDYKYRGMELENHNFLDYFVDTYEETLDRRQQTHTEGRGRPLNTRVPYLDLHPRSNTSTRVIRSKGHRNLPNIIGKWFARNDNADTYDLYCASVLACLKPWRELGELKGKHATWSEALLDFENTADDHQKCVKANMQYYYQCSDAATTSRGAGRGNIYIPHPHNDDDGIETSELINGVDLVDVVRSPAKDAQIADAERAVGIGRRLGLFGKQNEGTWSVAQDTVSLASEHHYRDVPRWTKALHKMNTRQDSNTLTPPQVDSGLTIQLDTMLADKPQDPAVLYVGNAPAPILQDPDVSMLGVDQLRAYEIFKDHLDHRCGGESTVPQLLMHIQGEGGTGKSMVISKITDLLAARQQHHTLRKAAYTGIAASLIQGSTLHKLAELNTPTDKLGLTARKRLEETWKDTEYLIIDEVSMVSKHILGSISAVLSIAKQHPEKDKTHVPFGGISVVLAGDFHQFPPVKGKGEGQGALYAPVEQSHGTNAITGKNISGLFDTVILLRQQFRNEDKRWQAILKRLRAGTCTKEDIEIVRSLIASEKDKELFSQAPWTNAVLVTPRRAVRDRWNKEASRSHCFRTHCRLVISRAADYKDGKLVDRKTAALIASRDTDTAPAGKTSHGDPGGLPDLVYLAKGMPVLVTTNVETEMDVANGSRGIIEEIIVHSDENEPSSESMEFHLRRPPVCVLVRLDRTRASPIAGLEGGVIPIVPIRGGFHLIPPQGDRIRISREQVPLIPAYAFTDYRAQGQTLPHVIVDIGKPATGGISPFNAYVALSRSTSMNKCRLLRDFKDHLFQRAPSRALLNKDRELERKDRLTTLRYAARSKEGASSTGFPRS